MMPDEGSSHLSIGGVDINLADVVSVEDIEYKVPRCMSKEHCLRYGLTPDAPGEFWIVAIMVNIDTMQYIHFSDELTAKVSAETIRSSVEKYHEKNAELFDLELDTF